MPCREDLEKPLLQNGHAGDEENHSQLDLPPHLSSRASESTMSSSAMSSDDESHPPPPKSAFQRLLDSPTLATACCVFLCFILKVVQQVRLVCRSQHLHASSSLQVSLAAGQEVCLAAESLAADSKT